MREDELARRLGVAGADGLEDLLVRLLRHAGRAHVTHIVERLDEEVPVSAHRRREELVLRRLRERDVEVHARLGVRELLPDAAPAPLHHLTKPPDGRLVRPLRRELGRGGLDDGASFGELRERHVLQEDHRRDRLRDVVGVRLGDERAAGRADLDADEPARLEDPERVPDSDARDAELLRELALRLQPVTRRELAVEDRPLDLRHDLTRCARLANGGEHHCRPAVEWYDHLPAAVESRVEEQRWQSPRRSAFPPISAPGSSA